MVQQLLKLVPFRRLSPAFRLAVWANQEGYYTKYTTTIGDGSNSSFLLTVPALTGLDMSLTPYMWSMYDTTSKLVVVADVTLLGASTSSISNVGVKFGHIPSVNQYSFTIIVGA